MCRLGVLLWMAKLFVIILKFRKLRYQDDGNDDKDDDINTLLWKHD